MVLGYNAYNSAIIAINGLAMVHNCYWIRYQWSKPSKTHWSGVQSLPGYLVLVHWLEGLESWWRERSKYTRVANCQITRLSPSSQVLMQGPFEFQASHLHSLRSIVDVGSIIAKLLLTSESQSGYGDAGLEGTYVRVRVTGDAPDSDWGRSGLGPAMRRRNCFRNSVSPAASRRGLSQVRAACGQPRPSTSGTRRGDRLHCAEIFTENFVLGI